MTYRIEIKRIFIDGESGKIKDNGWRLYKKYKSKYHAMAAAFSFCIPSFHQVYDPVENDYAIPMARIIIKEEN